MRVSGKRIPLLLMSAVLVLATVSTAFRVDTAGAAQILNRSLTLETGPAPNFDGGSKANGVVKHFFQFTLPTTGSVGSIKFEYCTTATGGPCVMPTGVVTTSATLETETGATGFTMVNTTNGAPYLTRTAAGVTGPQAVTYRLNNVTNPTAENASFFVRITTYASTDTTGASTDTGTVTASTARQIELTGIMPESIIFCTGETIALNAGNIPDCSTATPGAIDFNDLFSPSATSYATSQMAASTNATNGYSITVAGGTLTSGSNTIPDMDVAAVSTVGVGQFGLNLVLNDGTVAGTPNIAASANIFPASNTTNYKGKPIAGFDTNGTFKFDSTATNLIAASDDGGAGPTDTQRYTVSYIVNVSGSQVAGTYTSTLTYVCTATF